MSEFEDLEEFGDFVSAGRDILDGHDRDLWVLGGLVALFEYKVGRPDDPDAPTQRELAREWGVGKSQVNAWYKTYVFYPDIVRIAELSFSHHDLARRNADDELENALELLHTAARQHMSVQDFRRWLAGTFFEMPIERHKLPDEVRYLVPPSYKEILLVGRKLKEEV